jgi:crotonobetainyl-CoA:carnitine CoA-transferase CaiB-like acyl-CoA transferase
VTGPAPGDGRPGPLDGLRVVELASEWTAFAGRLLGELGAQVILVEPPEGAAARQYGPFLEDRPGIERSLWWWHYQSSKLGVTVDVGQDAGADTFRRLADWADVVLEGEEVGRLASLGLDHTELRATRPALIWVSVTPFGRDNPRAGEPATDLTILSGGGPVWSCGYDDHSLPPVRGGGNQASHTAGLHAVAATLVAVLHRSAGGPGQHIDVSMHAAANVTTEAGSYHWLVARQTVQRQTGRHASHRVTAPTMAMDRDGRPVNTGFPPTSAAGFRAVLGWLTETGLIDEFPDSVFLQIGVDRGGVRTADLASDVETQAIYGAARDALTLLASRTSGYEFFVEGQRRGLAVGVIYAPEEVFADPHFEATGFPTPVWQNQLDRSVVHAGSGLAFERSPWRISGPAPRLGEHNDILVRLDAGVDRGSALGRRTSPRRPGPR